MADSESLGSSCAFAKRLLPFRLVTSPEWASGNQAGTFVVHILRQQSFPCNSFLPLVSEIVLACFGYKFFK